MAHKVRLTDKALAGYMHLTGTRRNVLCPLPPFDGEGEVAGRIDGADEEALAAALRPTCVIQVGVLLYNDGLLMLLCAERDGSAVLIGREQDDNLLVPVDPGDTADTLLAHLLEFGEPDGAPAGMRLGADSFLLLLAIADTYRRGYLGKLLAHDAGEVSLSLEELGKTLKSAIKTPDTRWLYPFTLMSMGFPALDDLPAAIDGLRTGGVLKEEGFALTENGERLVEDLMYRLAAGHIRTLRVRGEALVEEELLIVRTHSSLWCATLGEEVMLLTVTVRELADMIYKICEGIDEPRDQEIPAQDPLGKTRGATSPDGSWRCACGRSNMGNYCAGCGKPQPKAAQGSPPASEDKSWRCACGRTNTGNFCDGCGAKRP